MSENIGGCIIEAGPDSFLTLKPQAVDLCERLGLSDLLIGTNSERSKGLRARWRKATKAARRA